MNPASLNFSTQLKEESREGVKQASLQEMCRAKSVSECVPVSMLTK